jgi:long-chain acyl-CoA synthetase
MQNIYPYQNFYEMISANATNSAKKTLIFIDDEKISNLEFLHKVDAFARFLSHSGMKDDDKIAIITPNSVEFLIAFFAISKIGSVIVPVNNMLKEEEYSYILNDADVKMLVTSSKFAAQTQNLQELSGVEKTVWIDKLPETEGEHFLFSDAMSIPPFNDEIKSDKKLDDLALLIYTSGTTGHPKGAMLSFKNIFSNVYGGKERFNLTQKDRFIVYLPMFHSFTLSISVLLPIFIGGSMIIIPSVLPFSNIIKQTLLKRVTVFLGIPDVYNALVRARLPWYFVWFNSVRAFVSGGAPLSEDTLTKFNSIFKRANMLEGYGLSECSPAVSINPVTKQKPLSIGLPLYGYEVKIVDEEMVEVPNGQIGELIVKGDCVMMGYWKRPTATDETIINGWVKTGDLGKIDDEGYIYIVDRKKDLIISKGINIYPREIEEVLYLHPSVKAAAVIGIKDENNGEIPIAYVELDPDEPTLTESAVKIYLKQHLANFKIPKNVHFLDELPKNATGKVLKRVLKEKHV